MTRGSRNEIRFCLFCNRGCKRGMGVSMTKPHQKSDAILPEGMLVKALTINLAGLRFGRLIALNVVGKKNSSLLWQCACDCGQQVHRTSATLRKKLGAVASCGCYLKETSRERLLGAAAWNKGKTYATKTDTEEYRTRKSWAEAVRRARGLVCESCGWDKAPCDVHHTIPRSAGGKNTVENGQVLCPNCHRLAHVTREFI